MIASIFSVPVMAPSLASTAMQAALAPSLSPSLSPSFSPSLSPVLAPSLTPGQPVVLRPAAAAAAAPRPPSLGPAALAPSEAGPGTAPARPDPVAAALSAPALVPSVAVAQQGVFVTPQSLATFAGATLAVTLLWNVSGILVSGWGGSKVVGLVASILVGGILYLISETDPARGPVSRTDRLIGIFVAVINTLIIFFAAIGSSIAPSLAAP